MLLSCSLLLTPIFTFAVAQADVFPKTDLLRRAPTPGPEPQKGPPYPGAATRSHGKVLQFLARREKTGAGKVRCGVVIQTPTGPHPFIGAAAFTIEHRSRDGGETGRSMHSGGILAPKLD